MNLYIITEYAGNGDMFQRLRRLAQKRQMMPEDKAWVFFIQLAIGIQALHLIKIGDLGVAKLFAATRCAPAGPARSDVFVGPHCLTCATTRHRCYSGRW
eukprot:COSAG02_NODE_27015_length_618_cov_101.722543_1_plen_98_part_10